MEYPYVLVVNGQPLGKRNATGLTLRSFFKQWPKERVFEIYQWETLEYEDKLDFTSILIPRRVFPLSHMLRKMSGRITTMEETIVTKADTPTISVNKHRTTSLSTIVKYCSETQFINIRPVVKLLEQYDFKPEVIYTNGADFGVMKLSYMLSKKYNAGCCLHYMDNWRETLYTNVPFLNKRMNVYADRLERRSKVGIAISDKMAKAYSELYHHEYVPVMNSAMPHEIHNDNSSNAVSFVYAGGLHLGRGESLLEVEGAIKAFVNQSNSIVRLVIYTNMNSRLLYEKKFDSSITEFRDFLPHDRVNEVYDSADVLVHIESFEKERILYTKYSMSTKIPEYLSSGKPILCYAPNEIAVYQYVDNNKVGISCCDKETLMIAIDSLSKSRELRQKLGQEGFRLFEKNHLQNAVADKFKNAIIQNVINNA